MNATAPRVRAANNLELICGVVVSMSAIAVALELFVCNYLTDGWSLRLVAYLIMPALPSLIFGIAASVHVRTRKRSALFVMIVSGSLSNTSIAIPGVGLMYVLASIQDTPGLLFLTVNFFSVLATLTAALIADLSVCDDRHPVN